MEIFLCLEWAAFLLSLILTCIMVSATWHQGGEVRRSRLFQVRIHPIWGAQTKTHTLHGQALACVTVATVHSSNLKDKGGWRPSSPLLVEMDGAGRPLTSSLFLVTRIRSELLTAFDLCQWIVQRRQIFFCSTNKKLDLQVLIMDNKTLKWTFAATHLSSNYILFWDNYVCL